MFATKFATKIVANSNVANSTIGLYMMNARSIYGFLKVYKFATIFLWQTLWQTLRCKLFQKVLYTDFIKVSVFAPRKVYIGANSEASRTLSKFIFSYAYFI